METISGCVWQRVGLYLALICLLAISSALPAVAADPNTAEFIFNADGSITVDANEIALWQVLSSNNMITTVEDTPDKVAEFLLGSGNPITGTGTAYTSDDFSAGVTEVLVADESTDLWYYRTRYQLSGEDPVDVYYVPEPTMAGVLVLGAVTLLRRKRNS